MAMLKLGGCEWIHDPDGEYNDWSTKVADQTVRIYSDREESSWDCQVNDGDPMTLHAECRNDAMIEAIVLAKY